MPCTVCHVEVAGADRQNHVGCHVLRSQRGLPLVVPSKRKEKSTVAPAAVSETGGEPMPRTLGSVSTICIHAAEEFD